MKFYYYSDGSKKVKVGKRMYLINNPQKINWKNIVRVVVEKYFKNCYDISFIEKGNVKGFLLLIPEYKNCELELFLTDLKSLNIKLYWDIIY